VKIVEIAPSLRLVSKGRNEATAEVATHMVVGIAINWLNARM
jgi:hypothetical protein